MPKNVHIITPRICDYVPLQGKRAFADVIKLRIFIWEDYLNYRGGPKVMTCVLIKGKQEGQSQRLEDAMLLALKMEP